MPVGTSAWYAWLETATTFTFASDVGRFTAHKARAGNRRGGWYWRAYRRQRGRLSHCYLGVSGNLTLPCLNEAAYRLAARAGDAEIMPEASGQKHDSRAISSPNVRTPVLILNAKCAVPRLPVQHVPRAHLVALLERGATGPLTLVSAPAGSGKTTLLAEWARTTSMPVAWLSLETADRDPAHFLAYLLPVLRSLDKRISPEAGALPETKATPDLVAALASLVNDLHCTLATDTALVLDDAHVLEGEAAQKTLLFLLEHLPERLHLVLGTRVDPPLPLARLRARGHVRELRAESLRFALSEVQAFLREMDLALTDEALSSLEQRTEGWVAGVQLAALVMRGRDDPEAFLRRFHGNHRFIQEYIGEEILARRPALVRAFLLQTSILERLSAPLCDAVTANIGSQAMLEAVHKANLFISALDDTGGWYRYHTLFAEGLRHQLLQQAPELFPELCARASAWYEAHDMLFEACEYALQARDYARAVPLIERQVGKLIGNVQFPLLQRLLDQVPPDIIASRPLLGVASVWALLVEDDQSEQLAQQVARLQRHFQQQSTTPDQTDQAEWAEAYAHLNFMRVLQAIGNHDAEGALEVAQQTLQALPVDATPLRSLASVCLGLAEGTAHRLNGDYAAAERVLIQAGTQPEATSYHFLNLVAVATLAEIYEAQGALQQLARLYQRQLQTAHAYKEAPPELFLWVHMNYANLLLEWNHLDEAQEVIQVALAADQGRQIKELTLGCRFIQLWISQARGRDEETRELLQSLENELASRPSTQPVMAFDALGRVRLWLSQGKLDEAARWLSATGWRYDDPFIGQPDDDYFFAKYITLARILLAQGRQYPREAHLSQAMALLEGFRPVYEHAGCTGRVSEILLLTALVLQAQGKTKPALTALGRALSLAESAGYVRLFAKEGEPLANLLTQVGAYTTASPRYLRQLQAAMLPIEQALPDTAASAPPQALMNPLSAREHEVLALLAAGASNQQIADQLVISLNTAKRHVKHLLAKLAATNRTQAVACARELHLL